MEVEAALPFVEYLGKELNLELVSKPAFGAWSEAGTTLGALSLKLGLMDMEQINECLERQEERGGYFGEVAIELTYLTKVRVSTLLNIQKWSRRSELLQRLFLEIIDQEQYLRYVAKAHVI